MNNEQLGLNFETGEVLRGETQLMTVEELLFLVGSAVQYNKHFPIEQSQEFVEKLQEMLGNYFTPEQFQEIKQMMQAE